MISPPDYAGGGGGGGLGGGGGGGGFWGGGGGLPALLLCLLPPFISTLNEVTQSTAILSWDEITGAEFYQLDLSNNGFQTFFRWLQ